MNCSNGLFIETDLRKYHVAMLFYPVFALNNAINNSINYSCLPILCRNGYTFSITHKDTSAFAFL